MPDALIDDVRTELIEILAERAQAGREFQECELDCVRFGDCLRFRRAFWWRRQDSWRESLDNRTGATRGPYATSHRRHYKAEQQD